MTPAFGVYIHVPFCSRKCDYCAFATWASKEHLIQKYLQSLALEIESAAPLLPEVQTIFIGGGSPSLVPSADLMAACTPLQLAQGYEFTVECNPEQVDAELLDDFQASGVNRISMGVQSLDSDVLVALGRDHDPMMVERAVELVRGAGFAALNLDLIYGGAGETLEQWRATLDAAVKLSPDHISAYALTVEPGTPLADDPARHPNDDDQADKYLVADDVLTAAGLDSYEISNWSRPGFESQHNRLYWGQGNYRGFGCAAHSHENGRRWWNLHTPERYVAAVSSGISPEAGAEELDSETRRIEGLQLALRTREGIDASAIPDEVRHLVTITGDRATLTREGRLLANEVAVRLR